MRMQCSSGKLMPAHMGGPLPLTRAGAQNVTACSLLPRMHMRGRRGGFAACYKGVWSPGAREQARIVALKVLLPAFCAKPSCLYYRQFVNEATLLRRVAHRCAQRVCSHVQHLGGCNTTNTTWCASWSDPMQPAYANLHASVLMSMHGGFVVAHVQHLGCCNTTITEVAPHVVRHGLAQCNLHADEHMGASERSSMPWRACNETGRVS